MVLRMSPLTVVGYASGSPLSQIVMSRIAREHRLLAVVMPKTKQTFRQFVRRSIFPVREQLAALGVPLTNEAGLTGVFPDLVVVASFPQILSASALARGRLGALNIHMSLLPRHRGADPIFWTYWDDDTEAGVTVHWMNPAVDGGDIAVQQSVPLARGKPSRELYSELTDIAADLLSGVMAQIAAGSQSRRPQPREGGSLETMADIARARIPFVLWPAERVWHVLRGLGDQRTGLINDTSGTALQHGRATHFRQTGDVEPGRINSTLMGWDLHCLDGIVSVDRLR